MQKEEKMLEKKVCLIFWINMRNHDLKIATIAIYLDDDWIYSTGFAFMRETKHIK